MKTRREIIDADIRAVADSWGVTYADIVGRSRTRRYVRARQHAMFILYDKHGLSTPRVGQIIGKRDHSTVWSAIRKHCGRCGIDPKRVMRKTTAWKPTLMRSPSIQPHTAREYMELVRYAA